MQDFPSSSEGKRGQNLLNFAISCGRLPIVQKLLDLGVSANELYGLPLTIKSYEGTLPLRHAISAGYADIVALLLERGADIHARDAKGSPYETVSCAPVDVRRVIENKIASTDRESFRQYFFTRDLMKSNWPEVFRLLKEGLVPTGIEILPWALEALSQRQYALVKLLVERGLLQKMTTGELAKAIDHAPLAWSMWFVSQMVKNGLDLNIPITQAQASSSSSSDTVVSEITLLELALQNSNYALAAFLISLGANPAKAGALQAPLAHYASQLQKGSETEQHLRSLINVKNVAHLVGDPIIKKMLGDDRKKLEGSLSSETIAFFSACLDFMQHEHPEMANHAFEKVCRRMQQAQEFALRIESLQQLTNDEAISIGIEHLEEYLLGKIDRLQIGEAIVIPAGWQSGDIGHAILIECKRRSDNQLTIDVINTGDGVEYHGYAHDGARLHVNTLKHHRISKVIFRSSHIFPMACDYKIFFLRRSSWIGPFPCPLVLSAEVE